MNQTRAVTDETFNTEVKQSPLPVIVAFTAEWCGPCQRVAPILEELAVQFTGLVKIVKINMDESPNAGVELGVRTIPALFIFKDGEAISNKVGSATKTDLQDWIKEAIA